MGKWDDPAPRRCEAPGAPMTGEAALFAYDRRQGVSLLCGVDEAGRGPLAGDVYAAAVILPPDLFIEGLNDSKRLTPRRRETLYDEIREKARAFSVASASVAEIERLNILQATFLAMRRAVEGLTLVPQLVLVDGNRNPRLPVHSRCVVRGDATSACIAAASILAKVERDRDMERLDRSYPQYHFARHKGYGTALHYRMLDEFGPSPVHRLSFLKKYEAGNRPPDTGALGEKAAADWLLAQGFRILARNWRCRYGELDLVAEREGRLVFAEVKTRTAGAAASGKEAVTPAKQKKLVRAAQCWLQERPTRLLPRFDVLEVRLSRGEPQTIQSIHHYPAAFDASAGDERD